MVCSNTRGLAGGGGEPGAVNKIEYITINTTGNHADFGDLTAARVYAGGASSNTRGLFAGGATPSNSDIVDIVNIAFVCKNIAHCCELLGCFDKIEHTLSIYKECF